jgi:formylmethanofuran dehydrogenase subunit D
MSWRIDQLKRIALSGYVKLNREDTLQMGAAAGERVRVTSSYGSRETPVKVSSAVSRDFAFVPNY